MVSQGSVAFFLCEQSYWDGRVESKDREPLWDRKDSKSLPHTNEQYYHIIDLRSVIDQIPPRAVKGLTY